MKLLNPYVTLFNSGLFLAWVGVLLSLALHHQGPTVAWMLVTYGISWLTSLLVIVNILSQLNRQGIKYVL